jgi:hypothetical protein
LDRTYRPVMAKVDRNWASLNRRPTLIVPNTEPGGEHVEDHVEPVFTGGEMAEQNMEPVPREEEDRGGADGKGALRRSGRRRCRPLGSRPAAGRF